MHGIAYWAFVWAIGIAIFVLPIVLFGWRGLGFPF